jgi:ABC-type polysaccharide/polyol phosphate export permease
MMSGFFAGFHKLMRRGLFFASSVIIPVPLLPDGAIRDILLLNPLVHINETLRSSTSGIYYEFIDQSYVLEISLFLLLLIIPVIYIKQKYISEGIITLNKSTTNNIDF